MIDWDSSDSHLLMNPSYSSEEQERFRRFLTDGLERPGHVWLSTSGSSAQKWVGLSKEALLASASAVNRHLKSTQADIWVNSLPDFHVGGLGIYARSYLTGARLCDFRKEVSSKWNPEAFHRYLNQVKGSLTSLVPTQLHDLVRMKFEPPSSLRSVVIGGGALHPLLFANAKALGWPVLPSYGLTECGSQVATAPLDSWKDSCCPPLKILSHLQVDVENGRFIFSGSSLLTVYALIEGETVTFIDPKENGWFQTEDRGKIVQGFLEVEGRVDSIVKIGGESVDLARLENLLQTLKLEMNFPHEVVPLLMPDDRLGASLHLVSDSPTEDELTVMINMYHAAVLPFERIRKIHLASVLPRSPLGKILKDQLVKMIVHQSC